MVHGALPGSANHGLMPKVGSAKGYGLHYLNPRRVMSGRFSSASVYGGHHGGFYSPLGGGMFQGAGNFVGNTVAKGRHLLAGNGRGTYQKQDFFEGGVTGRLGAVSKYERAAFSSGIMGSRRVDKANLTASRVLKMNNADAFTHFQSTGMNMSDSGAMRWATTEGMRGSKSKAFTSRLFTSGGGDAMFSDAGRAAETMFGGSLVRMSANAEKIASPLAKALESSPGLTNRALGRGLSRGVGLTATQEAEHLAMQATKKGLIKSFGAGGMKQLVAQGGAKMGVAIAGEALLAAIPGVNLIFAADLALQLGKLAGSGIKAGINFGKDAAKSMTGTMNNGIFGAGYKDNEVAATSRARGVQAIQNSRMNARSLLGAEGAMMAAHFG